MWGLQVTCMLVCLLYFLKRKKQFLDFCSEYKVVGKIHWQVALSSLAVLSLLTITGFIYGRAIYNLSLISEAWLTVAMLTLAVRSIVEYWRKFAEKY